METNHPVPPLPSQPAAPELTVSELTVSEFEALLEPVLKTAYSTALTYSINAGDRSKVKRER